VILGGQDATALILAIVLSALVLFGVGADQAVTLVGDWRRKGCKWWRSALAPPRSAS
jgi:hypothetical protein